MYKYICFIMLDLGLFIVPAHAATAWTSTECNAEKGGEIVEVGGDSFCRSLKPLNWWSVYSWCQAMGGRMPSIRELCPNAQSITQNASCGRSFGRGVWSATRPWFVNSGGALKNDNSITTSYYAYCVAKGSSS